MTFLSALVIYTASEVFYTSKKAAYGVYGHYLKPIFGRLLRVEGVGLEDRQDLLGHLLKL
ncbi:TPA: hypothetical protein ACPSKE_003130 [Legionella feeleii]